ncbi:MAG: carbamate kinase [Candidatus Aminicenantes bacterium]|nr:carbamate kinase [Candidatus Aminicenantes bacterium]
MSTDPKKTRGKKIVVALGGNAILQSSQSGTYEEQLSNVTKAVKEIVKLIRAGYRVALTHGNGPQIGNLYIQNSLAGEAVPPMPLDACSAQSQGMIGYFIQQEMLNELSQHNIDLPVISLVTQVQVRASDPAFKNPDKPIGPFHTQKEAELLMQKTSFVMKEDSRKRWRRVVPSPEPIHIVEKEVIKNNVEQGYFVIASGGGGIPVIKKKHALVGIEAVIDKDRSACRMGIEINADILLILTDIDRVALNFHTPKQKWIDRMNLKEAKKYLAQGHFKAGSMKPKIQASIDFLENGGEKSIISSLFSAYSAVQGKSGTTITKES